MKTNNAQDINVINSDSTDFLMNYSKSFVRGASQYERIMLTPINDNIYFFVSTEFE